MVEKIRAVNNPLTVIAIFAALAEVAGTVALGLIDKELQKTFVWFVMAFPFALVLLFYMTLNFNPKVLYAPSDYQNEENFINILIGKKELLVTIEKLNKQLEITKSQLLESSSLKSERKHFEKVVNEQILLLREQLQQAKESAEDFAKEATIDASPHSKLQALILDLLKNSPKELTPSEISRAVGIGESAVRKALSKLGGRGLVVSTSYLDEEEKYSLTP
jgi:DNA-binding transcriptional ArsR family regulator